MVLFQNNLQMWASVCAYSNSLFRVSGCHLDTWRCWCLLLKAVLSLKI